MRFSVALAAVLLLASACGESEEAQLERLSQKLEELHEAVAEAQEIVDEKEAALREYEEEAAAARTALREAEQELAALQEEAGSTATDTVVFRLVQRRLLDDAELEAVGIAASVRDGVVLLSGQVSSAELGERAVQIAQDVPGVTSVESRIQVLPAVSSEGPGSAR